MQVISTSVADVLIIQPEVYTDERGFFFESFNQRDFKEAVGKEIFFVQDNHSKSKKGVLRGLHYQKKFAQDKLVRVASGSIFDVVVDLRQSSATYHKWFGVELSAENKKQLWVPKGLAHGFLVISDYAEVIYKVSDYRYPEYEESINWSDNSLCIQWPQLNIDFVMSSKDAQGKSWDECFKFA